MPWFLGRSDSALAHPEALHPLVLPWARVPWGIRGPLEGFYTGDLSKVGLGGQALGKQFCQRGLCYIPNLRHLLNLAFVILCLLCSVHQARAFRCDFF